MLAPETVTAIVAAVHYHEGWGMAHRLYPRRVGVPFGELSVQYQAEATALPFAPETAGLHQMGAAAFAGTCSSTGETHTGTEGRPVCLSARLPAIVAHKTAVFGMTRKGKSKRILTSPCPPTTSKVIRFRCSSPCG